MNANADRKKPGPKPKSPEGSATKTISFRVRPSIREPLELAAKREARSVSEECEYRLVQSLKNEATIAEIFGKPEQRPLMLALCNVVRMAGVETDDKEDRLNDCYAAVIALIEGLADKSAKIIIDKAKASDRTAWERAARWTVALETGEALPENKPLSEIMGR